MQIPNTDSGCLNPKVGPIVRILGDPGGLGAWKNRLAKWARTQGTGSGRGSGSGIFSRGPAAGVAHSPVPMPAQSAQLPTVHNCGFLQKEPMLDDSIGLAKANSMPFHAPWAGLVGKGGGGCNECCGFRAPSSTCSPTLASLEGFSATVWQLYYSQHPMLLPSGPDALPGVAPQGTPEQICTQIACQRRFPWEPNLQQRMCLCIPQGAAPGTLIKIHSPGEVGRTLHSPGPF